MVETYIISKEEAPSQDEAITIARKECADKRGGGQTAIWTAGDAHAYAYPAGESWQVELHLRPAMI